jgi:hypothetical protein
LSSQFVSQAEGRPGLKDKDLGGGGGQKAAELTQE